MNYTTSVTTCRHRTSTTHFNSTLPSESLTPPKSTSQVCFEDNCVTWGGHYDGVELVNTCSIDNFITLLTLHKVKILEAFELTGEPPNSTIQSIFSMIDERDFDKLRLWAAPKLGISITNCECNLLGYEGKMVQFFKDDNFCLDIYTIIFQCCWYQSEKNKFDIGVDIFVQLSDIN